MATTGEVQRTGTGTAATGMAMSMAIDMAGTGTGTGTGTDIIDKPPSMNDSNVQEPAGLACC